MGGVPSELWRLLCSDILEHGTSWFATCVAHWWTPTYRWRLYSRRGLPRMFQESCIAKCEILQTLPWRCRDREISRSSSCAVRRRRGESCSIVINFMWMESLQQCENTITNANSEFLLAYMDRVNWIEQYSTDQYMTLSKNMELDPTAYYVCNPETVRLTAGTFLWFSVLDFLWIMVLICAGTIALWRTFDTSWASTSWLVWLGVFGWPWTSTFSVSSLALYIENSFFSKCIRNQYILCEICWYLAAFAQDVMSSFSLV